MNRPQKRKWWLYAILITAGAILIAFMLPVMNREPPTSKLNTYMWSIITATQQYTMEYGEPPRGTSLGIISALHGKNMRNIVYLETNHSDDSPLLDPWGTPFSIATADDRIVVSSAGEDKKWNTKDDRVRQKIIEHVPPGGRGEAPRP